MHRLQKSAGRAGIPVDSGVAIASLGILPEDESFEDDETLLLPALYPTSDPCGVGQERNKEQYSV